MKQGRPVRLTFDSGRKPSRKVVAGLSALVQVDRSLLTASDETTFLERLQPRSGGRPGAIVYGSHERLPLARFLPRGFDADHEADIEGLAFDGRYVWIVGSHSLVRPQPEAGARPRTQLARLRELEGRAERCLLARVPVDAGTGELSVSVSTNKRVRRAASLLVGRAGNALTRALAADRHIGPFLRLPSKDNGFDIEGIAVIGERVFLGLRGPVLGGWATVLEVKVGEAAPGMLKLERLSSGARYRKHFLDLGGLGVRDLCVDGKDLLILAGPTMKLDGPALVLRWPDVARYQRDGVIFGDELALVTRLPFGDGADHPEGMAVVRTGAGKPKLMIVFEKTSARRRRGANAVEARLFSI